MHLTLLPDLLVAMLLGGFWWLYLRGSLVHGPRTGRAVTFHLTMGLAALTLLGPVDWWAASGTAAHMSQHMLLVVIIAPLLVLSRPLTQLVAAGGRRAARAASWMLVFTARPVAAALIHGATLWIWHLPFFHNAASADPWWHALAHAMLLTTAGLFWWAVLSTGRQHGGAGLFVLLFTLMHTGLLGALLTFARAPLYMEAQGHEDQQLAGLVMWVVAGIPYLIGAGWCGYRWHVQLLRRP